MSTDRYTKFMAYLETEHWQLLETEFWRSHRRVCCVCDKTRAVAAQHIVYRSLTDCIPEDLLPLCPDCRAWLKYSYAKNLIPEHAVQAMAPADRAPYLRRQHRAQQIKLGLRSAPSKTVTLNAVVLDPNQQKPFKTVRNYKQ